jgi:hypothetical protein
MVMMSDMADENRAREQRDGLFQTMVNRRLDTLESNVSTGNVIGRGTEKRSQMILKTVIVSPKLSLL